MTLLLSVFLPCSASEDDPLLVAFGQSRPPYVDEGSQSGISIELFDNVAKLLKWSYKPVYVSNKRMERLLTKGKVDIAIEVQKTSSTLFYSMPFISYSNYAVHSHDPKFKLTTIAQLQNYSVCAWQNAREHLSLPQAFVGKADYFEYPKQQEQVIDWLAGKCEVILIDDTLLSWHLMRLREGKASYANWNWGKVLLPVKSNPLWFYAGFRDEQLRDSFNFALQRLKESGRYTQIREMIR